MLNTATIGNAAYASCKARGYYFWLATAEEMLGCLLDLASDEENKLADLYLDGFTPQEAVVEMRAQQELQTAC